MPSQPDKYLFYFTGVNRKFMPAVAKEAAMCQHLGPRLSNSIRNADPEAPPTGRLEFIKISIPYRRPAAHKSGWRNMALEI